MIRRKRPPVEVVRTVEVEVEPDERVVRRVGAFAHTWWLFVRTDEPTHDIIERYLDEVMA